jgi:hypothetical protein
VSDRACVHNESWQEALSLPEQAALYVAATGLPEIVVYAWLRGGNAPPAACEILASVTDLVREAAMLRLARNRVAA